MVLIERRPLADGNLKLLKVRADMKEMDGVNLRTAQMELDSLDVFLDEFVFREAHTEHTCAGEVEGVLMVE